MDVCSSVQTAAEGTKLTSVPGIPVLLLLQMNPREQREGKGKKHTHADPRASGTTFSCSLEALPVVICVQLFYDFRYFSEMAIKVSLV